VSVDAMDVSGEHQLDVDHNIYKKRLGPDGKAIAIEKGGTYVHCPTNLTFHLFTFPSI